MRAGETKLCERVKHNFLNASGYDIKFSASSANGSLFITWVLQFDTILGIICMGLILLFTFGCVLHGMVLLICGCVLHGFIVLLIFGCLLHGFYSFGAIWLCVVWLLFVDIWLCVE